MLEGGQRQAANKPEAMANEGQHGAERRLIRDNYMLFSVFTLAPADSHMLADGHHQDQVTTLSTLILMIVGGIFWNFQVRNV